MKEFNIFPDDAIEEIEINAKDENEKEEDFILDLTSDSDNVPRANPATLGKQAKKTEEVIDSAKKKGIKAQGIDRVMEMLAVDSILKSFNYDPNWEEVKNNEEYSEVLTALKDIISPYKNTVAGEINISQAQEDIVRIGAYLVNLSETLGRYQAQTAEVESRLERQRSAIYVRAKAISKEEAAKISDVDAKELSKFYSDDLSERLSNLNLIMRYIYSAYYSIKNFQDMLHYVTSREVKVNTPFHGS